MGLKKLNKPEPLARMAFNALRHSILANELREGVVYNEKSLAESLGISRTPVREALLELATKRLIRFLPQKGVVLNTFTEKDIEDVFEIRVALELFSIRKICTNPTAVDLSDLRSCLMSQKKAAETGDSLSFMEADRQFHLNFTHLTNNDFLLDTMQDIRDIMHLMGFRALGVGGRMAEVVEEHENILRAVETGKAREIMKQMEIHLDASRRAVHAARTREARTA